MKIDFKFISKKAIERKIKNKKFGKKYNIELNKEVYNYVKEDNRIFSIPSYR
ncbi:hypothetical protein [Sebaldella sp. S0638]|uniref:hypothetical protein n=1 Tax=Sebaldella sp. S0638 TaxID=2957809 RepID=UPI0020A22804|nr:hypothetical protein [Sebaldella sp. S0638]MCP1226756.1 hypothetical protein [Sebaldella sp. S0638]